MLHFRHIIFVTIFAISAGLGSVQKSQAAQSISSDKTESSADVSKTKPRFNYEVYGAGASLMHKLEAGLSKRFHSAGVDVTKNLPSAVLVLYVIRDKNSNVNKSGVTIAIAYVSNAETYKYAASTIKDKDEKPPPLLVDMVRNEGFLYHLSAAHLDKPSNEQVNEVLDAIVPLFLQKFGVKSGNPGDGG